MKSSFRLLWNSRRGSRAARRSSTSAAWTQIQPLEKRVLLTGPDTSPPIIVKTVLEDSTLVVTFSEDMAISGPGSVLDKANWQVRNDGTNAIPASAVITFSQISANNYEARIPITPPAAGQLLTLFARGTIQDLSGNFLDGQSTFSPGTDYFWTPISITSVAGHRDSTFGPSGGSALVNYFTTDPRTDSADKISYNSATGKYTAVGVASIPVFVNEKKTISYAIAMVQYNTDGSLDTSFGDGDGKVTTIIDTKSLKVSALVVDPVLGIFVGSNVRSQATNKFDMTVVRYDLTGKLVTSFGTGGISTIKFTLGGSAADSLVRSIAIDKVNNRLIAVGDVRSQTSIGVVAALKLSDGKQDPSFNSTGIRDFQAQNWTKVSSVICQSDGKILLAGTRYQSYDNYSGVINSAGLARLNSNGSLDTSFATGGVFSGTGTFASYLDAAGKMMIRNNRIIILYTGIEYTNPYSLTSGSDYGGEMTWVRMIQFQLNGTLDTTFGSGGISSSRWEGYVNDLDIDTYGHLVLAGYKADWKYGATVDDLIFTQEARLYYQDPFAGVSVTYSGPEVGDIFNSICIMPDGRIVLAGRGWNSSFGSFDFRIDRFTSSYQKDNTFGEDAFVFTDTNDVLTPTYNAASSIARQSDGKLIVAGSVWNGSNYDVAVSRLNSDGTLDTEFALGGRFTYAWTLGDSTDETVSAVAIQPDGSILVLVNVRSRNATNECLNLILKLNTLGEHVGGYINPNSLSNHSVANDMVIQPDGKVILVGAYREFTTSNGKTVDLTGNFQVTRLNADLTLDPNFYQDSLGSSRWDIQSSSDDEATDVTLDAQGRIYIAGWSKSSSTSNKLLTILRLKPDGTRDDSFNGNGKKIMALGYLDAVPVDLAIDSSNRLVIAANAHLTPPLSLNPTDGFAFVRLTSSGQFDTTLDGDGILYRSDVSSITGFAIQPDGKYVVVGDKSPYVRVMRFSSEGNLDNTFIGRGYEDYLFDAPTSKSADLILLPNANIAVVGTADPILGDGDSADFAVLMVQGDGPASVTLSPLTILPAGNRQGFIAKAFDPDLGDNAGYFVYNIDWNNDTDGTHWFDEHIVGTNQLTFYHTFTEPGVYPVVVSVTDRDGKIGPRITLYITVPEDDAPVVTDTETTLVYDENKLLLLAPGATLTDQLSPDFEGGSLTVSPTGFFDQNDRLSIRNQGTGAGQIGVNGSSVYYANTLIGTFTGGNANVPLVILLNAAATPAITQALIRNLTFEILSDSPVTTQRSIRIVVNDGDGKSSTPVDKTILVFSINDSPVLDPAGDPRFDPVNRSMVLQGQNKGTLVSDLLNRLAPLGSLTDADANALRGIAVFGLGGTTNGAWEFSIDGGTNWGPFYTPLLTNARLLAADANTRIRFVPKSGVKGVDATISFVAWDRVFGSNSGFADITQRGAYTAFSAASETATISVVNSAPDLNTAGSPTLDSIYRNQSNSTNRGTLISDLIARLSPLGSATDADTSDLLGIAINGLTGTGTWQFTIDNGATWSPIGTTGNSDARLLAVDPNTRIRYIPTAGFTGEVKIAFVAWDRTAGTNGSVANVSIRGGSTPFSLNFEYASLNVITPPLPNSVGVFRSGKFYLDFDGNRTWDATTGSDQAYAFGSTTDTPLVGDWNGDGVTDIGVWRAGKFYLDANANHAWNDKTGGDFLIAFGANKDTPITGDWNGDGITDIGTFRKGVFYLDLNGNQKWDGNSKGDAQITFGINGDIPIIGDWNGDGKSDIGVYRSGRFYIDANGNRSWDNLAGGDLYFNFGMTGDKPIAGDWNADGRADVGIVRGNGYYIDANGNRAWNNTTGGDFFFTFGTPTDIPVVGLWKLPTTGSSSPKPAPIPSALPLAPLSATTGTNSPAPDSSSPLETQIATSSKKITNPQTSDSSTGELSVTTSFSSTSGKAMSEDDPSEIGLLDSAFEDSLLLMF